MRNLVVTEGRAEAPAGEHSGPGASPQVAQTAAAKPAPSALENLAKRYAKLDERSRFGLRISRDIEGESYTSFVIGVTNENRRILILAAPKDNDGKLVPVAEGEVWLCRLFNASTVFRFMGTVLKVAQTPLPYLHVELPANIEKRMVRRHPRALAALDATLGRLNGERAVIVDLSVTGARIAVSAKCKLAKDARVQIFTTVNLLARPMRLIVKGKVSAIFGATDTDFPEVHFFGVEFDELDETTALALNGYVYLQLTEELDRVSRVLAIEEAAQEKASPVGEGPSVLRG